MDTRVILYCLLLKYAIATTALPEVHGEKFYYFGYGSNLLADRIHIANPTAERIAPGVLKNYRLDFHIYSDFWNGAAATILPASNGTVHGALWEIDLSNMEDIDRQEGVFKNFYRAITVPIIMANGTVVNARTYLMVNQPVGEVQHLPIEQIPFERQPSKTYLQCLVKGGIETGLPEDYVVWLKSIKHNNRTSPEMEARLKVQDVELLSE